MRTTRFLLITLLAVFLVPVAMVSDVQMRYARRIYDIDNRLQVPSSDTIIVLGASVTSKGVPSDALRDRLLVGIDLYKHGKGSKLIVTGDDGAFHVDEVAVMKKFIEDHGVPEGDIIVDDHGYRTYESCKREAQVFGVKKAIIVTQRFHLARALYLCNQLGIESYGVEADLQSYQRILFFWSRDLAASLKAWIDIHFIPPESPVRPQ